MDRMQSHVELACAIALLVLVIFGDAIIETIDPGRISRHIEFNKQSSLVLEVSNERTQSH